MREKLLSAFEEQTRGTISYRDSLTAVHQGAAGAAP